MTKWIEIKRDDKKTWPMLCDDILFSDGDTVWAGWLESWMEEEDPVFYSPFNDSSPWSKGSYAENITHWAMWPSPPS